MEGVQCSVVKYSLSCHQKQLLAGGNQLAQDTSEGLPMYQKLSLFRADSNPKGMRFEDRVISGIQKVGIGRSENLVCSLALHVRGSSAPTFTSFRPSLQL